MMTKAIYVLCSMSFSGTDVSVTELGKAAKGTEAVDPGANHGMNVFTHTFIQGLSTRSPIHWRDEIQGS